MGSRNGILENLTKSRFQTVGGMDYAKIKASMEHHHSCGKTSTSHHTDLRIQVYAYIQRSLQGG